MYTGSKTSFICWRRAVCAVPARGRLPVLMPALLLLAACMQMLVAPGFPSYAAEDAQALITEIMADPHQVPDEFGEWIELANIGDSPLDLAGWYLIVGEQRHLFAGEAVLSPGQYLVIGRHMDAGKNGGVAVDLPMTQVHLPNERGDVKLASPAGDVVDWVAWGGDAGPAAPTGASLERQGSTRSDPWGVAQARWPGSAGDLGSPGAPYAPLPPTATPTLEPTETPVPPTPTGTATDTPAPIPPTLAPTAIPTAPPAVLPRIRLSEIMANPAAVADEAGEWLELYNADSTAVNLNGWRLTDLDTDNHTIAGDLWIQPDAYVVLGRNGDITANGGVSVDYLYDGLAIANETDELLLVAPWGVDVDELRWGEGASLRVVKGASLERTGFGDGAGWMTASQPWPGSHGDLGSPGAPYVPPPLPPTSTPGAPPTLPPTVPPTLVPSATPLAPPAVLPRIRLSEIMANPAAVPDEAGEWLEVHNAGDAAVNLNGWLLADLDTDNHLIVGDLWIQPGGYLVLGRNGDVRANGGASVAYVYEGMALANETDELLLVAPWGAEVDRARWGDGASLQVVKGASLERAGFGDGAGWMTASQPWQGSQGDFGSPGAPYAPAPPTPTPQPTQTEYWPVTDVLSPLVIEEVFADGSEHEFIALANVGAAAIDLGGWSVGDAETPGDGEGVYALPTGVNLNPGELFIVARNGLSFLGRWGFPPDAEVEESDASIPTLSRRSEWASGSLALNDNGDEALLFNADMELADAVAWDDGQYPVVRLTGALHMHAGYSLQRVPGFRYPDAADVRHRFLAAPPQPGFVRSLPDAQPGPHPELGDGKTGVWGTMGARSNFSEGGQAPPHYIVAMAAARGLDFVAVADTDIVHSQGMESATAGIVNVPAWRWRNADGAEAVVYGDVRSGLRSWGDLREYLNSHGLAAQAQVEEPPAIPNLYAIRADRLSADHPGSLVQSWQTAGRPQLPAGNAVPPSDGVGAAQPRYTGLAVGRVDQAGVLEAVAARRGWLTSTPGMWLTLRTQGGVWMGQSVPAADEVTLDVHYGGDNGETAGLALWQDDRVLRQFDAAYSGQVWTVNAPAMAGSFMYVVATQLDGDFAVSAPLMVEWADGALGAPDSGVPGETASEEQRGGNGTEREGESASVAQTEVAAKVELGEAAGAPGTLANAKLQGLGATVEFRAQVVAPPGLFNSSIYVAEPAAGSTDVTGLGVQVYLRSGEYVELAEGDWVLVRGRMQSFRGEMETVVEQPDQVWRFDAGPPVRPLPIRAYEVGESLEGRLVTFSGEVAGWQGDSIYLCDPDEPEIKVRVTVRSSLDWRRPYVNVGERWQATGIVSQFAKEHPWNGGYRVLVRYPHDLVELDQR